METPAPHPGAGHGEEGSGDADDSPEAQSEGGSGRAGDQRAGPCPPASAADSPLRRYLGGGSRRRVHDRARRRALSLVSPVQTRPLRAWSQARCAQNWSPYRSPVASPQVSRRLTKPRRSMK